MPIRPSAKAVIIQNGHLLAVKKQDSDGDFFILPGGGQEHGETLEEAVKRECLEEIGTTVEVRNLIFVRDYIGKNHQYAADEREGQVHALELMFLCSIPNDSKVSVGTNPDQGQVGIEWLVLDELTTVRLYPKGIREPLSRLMSDSTTNKVYLGDIN